MQYSLSLSLCPAAADGSVITGVEQDADTSVGGSHIVLPLFAAPGRERRRKEGIFEDGGRDITDLCGGGGFAKRSTGGREKVPNQRVNE